MESYTTYGDFVVKLIWRLSGYLIEHVFSIETPDNVHTNFLALKSP